MTPPRWVPQGCYLVTSGTSRATVDAAAAAARAGFTLVQVRVKDAATRDLLALVTTVADAVARANPETRVVVDDRADVAFAARLMGAPVHGVHLGQDDLPPEAARALLGPEALVGWTTGTVELAALAEAHADVLDYVGCGPFRPTPTKDSGRVPLGTAGYPAIVGATRLPVFAIGDVTVNDVPDLRATGVAGVCVVRAVMEAADPEAAAREIVAAWES